MMDTSINNNDDKDHQEMFDAPTPRTTLPLVWVAIPNQQQEDQNPSVTTTSTLWRPAVLIRTTEDYYEVAFADDLHTTYQVGSVEAISTFSDPRLQTSFEASDELNQLLSRYRDDGDHDQYDSEQQEDDDDDGEKNLNNENINNNQDNDNQDEQDDDEFKLDVDDGKYQQQHRTEQDQEAIPLPRTTYPLVWVQVPYHQTADGETQMTWRPAVLLRTSEEYCYEVAFADNIEMKYSVNSVEPITSYVPNVYYELDQLLVLFRDDDNNNQQQQEDAAINNKNNHNNNDNDDDEPSDDSSSSQEENDDDDETSTSTSSSSDDNNEDDDEDVPLPAADDDGDKEGEGTNEQSSSNEPSSSVLSHLSVFEPYSDPDQPLGEVIVASAHRTSIRNNNMNEMSSNLVDLMRDNELAYDYSRFYRHQNNENNQNKLPNSSSFTSSPSFSSFLLGEDSAEASSYHDENDDQSAAENSSNKKIDQLLSNFFTQNQKQELILIGSFHESFSNYGFFSQFNHRPAFFGTYPILEERFPNAKRETLEEFKALLTKSNNNNNISKKQRYVRIRELMSILLLSSQQQNNYNINNNEYYETDSARDDWDDLVPSRFYPEENQFDFYNNVVDHDNNINSSPMHFLRNPSTAMISRETSPFSANSAAGFIRRKNNKNNKKPNESDSDFEDDGDYDFDDDMIVPDEEDEQNNENGDLAQLQEVMLQRDSYSTTTATGTARNSGIVVGHNNNNSQSHPQQQQPSSASRSTRPRAQSSSSGTRLFLHNPQNQNQTAIRDNSTTRRMLVQEEIRKIRRARRLAKKMQIGSAEAKVEGPYVNSSSLLTHPAPLNREYLSFPRRAFPESTKDTLVSFFEWETDFCGENGGLLDFKKTFPELFRQVDPKAIQKERGSMMSNKNKNENNINNSKTNKNTKHNTDDVPFARLIPTTLSASSSSSSKKPSTLTSKNKLQSSSLSEDQPFASMMMMMPSSSSATATAVPPMTTTNHQSTNSASASVVPTPPCFSDEAEHAINILRSKDFIPPEVTIIKKCPEKKVWLVEGQVTTIIRRLFAIDQVFREHAANKASAGLLDSSAASSSSPIVLNLDEKKRNDLSLNEQISLVPAEKHVVEGINFHAPPRKQQGCEFRRSRVIAKKLLDCSSCFEIDLGVKITDSLIEKLAKVIEDNYQFVERRRSGVKNSTNDGGNNIIATIDEDAPLFLAAVAGANEHHSNDQPPPPPPHPASTNNETASSSTEIDSYWESKSQDAEIVETFIRKMFNEKLQKTKMKKPKKNNNNNRSLSSTQSSQQQQQQQQQTQSSSQQQELVPISLSQQQQQPKTKSSKKNAVVSENVGGSTSSVVVATPVTNVNPTSFVQQQQQQQQSSSIPLLPHGTQLQQQIEEESKDVKIFEDLRRSCSSSKEFFEKLDVQKLVHYLTLKNVNSVIVKVIEKEKYSGPEFVDEEFVDDAFSSDVLEENGIKALHLKVFKRMRDELLRD